MSSYCPHCGNLAVEGAAHCTQCGTPLGQADDPTAVLPVAPPMASMSPPVGPPLGGTPPPGYPAAGALPPTGPPPGTPPPTAYAGGEPPKPGPNTGLVVAVAVLATLLVVGIVAVILTRGGDDDTPATTTAPLTTAPTTTEAPTSTAPSTTAATTTTVPATTTTAPPATSAPTGDVTAQPAGLFCRDLNSRGFSYADAVDYWEYHDRPARMDADRNGIPCETVYPRSAVAEYWGSNPGGELQDVPAGLKCADLKARGFSYSEAVAYWFATGAPDLMDADRNGIPCETVYPRSVVDDYWAGD